MRTATVCLSLLLGGLLAWSTGGLAQEQEVDPTDVERFTDGDPAAGAKLYKRYCSGCHGADGRGGAHTFMPHVQNLTKKDYIEMVPDGYLYLVIAEGGGAVGKNSYMPAWESTLSEQDIKDIIAHIRDLPTY
jgi:mono/diheme cytochrome c family protein